MVDECMGCCTAGDDDDDDAQRYLSAIFTVCSCRFRSNPALASLVRRIPKEFPNVKIRVCRRLIPMSGFHSDPLWFRTCKGSR